MAEMERVNAIGHNSLNINGVCDRGVDRAAMARVSVLVKGGSYTSSNWPMPHTLQGFSWTGPSRLLLNNSSR